MRNFVTTTVLASLIFTMGCPEPETAVRVGEKPSVEETKETPATAMVLIRQAHAAFEANCGKDFPKAKKVEELAMLKIPEADQKEADSLLQEIGLFAQQCASYDVASLKAEAPSSCDPSCHWCPIKWYWCIENAGACAGGDNEACCKLGACGSKHHCEEVCESSCGCNVHPLPAVGGGGGEE